MPGGRTVFQAWTVPARPLESASIDGSPRSGSKGAPYEEGAAATLYQFEPILSPICGVYDRGFRIKTPFSRTVVDELRQRSFTRWDGDDKGLGGAVRILRRPPAAMGSNRGGRETSRA